MKRDSNGTGGVLPNYDMFRTFRGSLHSESMLISGPVSRETNFYDRNFQIRSLETEAYGAVLRAFIVQSDSLSWSKESLITELRKELRVSDDEHRKILGAINSDESIKAVREWRTSNDDKLATNPVGFDPNSVGHVSRKKLKMGHSPKCQSSVQPSPTDIPSAIAVHVRDDKRHKNAALLSYMNGGQTTLPVPRNRHALIAGEVGGSLIVHSSNKNLDHSEFQNLSTEANVIEIRATDKLIYEVEKLCGGKNPDPIQVERAQLILREHERALQEALAKVGNVLDGDEAPVKRQCQYSSEEPKRKARGFDTAAYQKLDRARNYYAETYVKDQAKRDGIPCIDLQDDDYG